MRREATNATRYVLEELIPPVIRDSRAMRGLLRFARIVPALELDIIPRSRGNGPT